VYNRCEKNGWLDPEKIEAGLLLQRQRIRGKYTDEEMLAALEAHGNNRTKAAKALGVTDGAVRYRLKARGWSESLPHPRP
jgi:transcriptional regulator with PAS, ATPase and Fis domain